MSSLANDRVTIERSVDPESIVILIIRTLPSSKVLTVLLGTGFWYFAREP